MKAIYSLTLVASLFASSAFAKITVFSNEEAVKAVLSAEAPEGSAPGYGHELTNISVKQETEQGNGGPVQVFEVTLTYENASKDPRAFASVCTGGATVRSEIVKSGGITASKLGKPEFYGVRCTR